MKEQTIIIIKPDGVKKKIIGECLRRFEQNNLEIVEIKAIKMDEATARNFYKHLKEKLPAKLFLAIIKYMSSDRIIAAVIQGDGAVKKVREICGNTNPKEAGKGTIRGDFGEDDLHERAKKMQATRNIIH